jgi:hypothetical protein
MLSLIVIQPLYYTAMLIVQQGPVGSVGSASLELELVLSMHIGVMGSPGGCGWVSARKPERYDTFQITPEDASRVSRLLEALELPDREPELSWRENLTGDAWTSITLFVEACNMAGKTLTRTVSHQLIEPSRYQGRDAGGYEQLIASLLEIADAKDGPIWHKVQRASMRPPPPPPGALDPFKIP